MKIQIAGIMEESIVDGPGIRLVIFTQGCPHHCRGCHNPETWNLTGGTTMDTDDFDKYMSNPLLTGITLSGGEPFIQQDACIKLADAAHGRGLDVWCYTGFLFEQIKNVRNYAGGRLIDHIDVLVDGKFEQDRKSLNLRFRGSSNQRIIDVKKSMDKNEVVLFDCK